jgi:hypothetical protein
MWQEKVKYFLERYKRLILIIAAILLILLIVFLSIPWKKKAPAVMVPTSTIIGQELVLDVNAVPDIEVTEEDRAKATITTVAKNFAEIYGTYSNQSNFQNVEGALPLLSSAYRAEMSAFLSGARASYKPSAEYKGVTTVALNIMTESIDNAKGQAIVLVKTQKAESSGSQDTYATKYQDMRVTLVKEGGNWLVDDSEWIK